MPEKGLKKRPTVAYFTSELEGDYACILAKGVIDAVEEYDLNLIIFPGKALKAPYDYQYQNNVIYNLAGYENVDALIMSPAVFSNYLTKDEVMQFYKQFLPLPIVSISVPIAGAAGIKINNKSGLRDALDHLIRDHGRRRIAFIQGPDNNDEAVERFNAYREALAEHGIPFDPELVAPGDFSCFAAVEAVQTFLDVRKVDFDALVAANDEMALTALSIFQKRGFRIPDDIVIIGFDNIEGARYSSPSLTTVRQPLYEMGKKSVELALALIRGMEITSITFDTELVIRESCGCSLEAFESPALAMVSCPNKETAVPDLCDLSEIQNSFIAMEMKRMGNTSFSKEKVAHFIEQVFNTLLNSSDGPPPTQNLLNLFITVFSRYNMSDEDILYFQNLITRLRNQILPLTASGNNGACTGQTSMIEDFFHKTRISLTDMFQQANAKRWALHHNDLRVLRSALNSMIYNIHELDEALGAIYQDLKSTGINNCYIYLYTREITHYKGEVWQPPPVIVMAMAYNDEKPDLLASSRKSFPMSEALNNEFLPQYHRYSMVVNSLFFKEDQLGFMLCDFNLKDSFMYESLFMEISCALKLSILIKAREQIENKLREALWELEDYNYRLNTLSQTDELTGLHNRRGFLNLARQSLQLAYRMGKTGLLFYADLDGLKMINDTYGHDEGDNAIIETGNLLKKAFRVSDIIARLGGDEFTIFTVDTTPDLIPILQNRLYGYINEYNRQSGKPYQISISLGAVVFCADQNLTIEQLLSQADSLLYEQKKAKYQKKKWSSRQSGDESDKTG